MFCQSAGGDVDNKVDNKVDTNTAVETNVDAKVHTAASSEVNLNASFGIIVLAILVIVIVMIALKLRSGGAGPLSPERTSMTGSIISAEPVGGGSQVPRARRQVILVEELRRCILFRSPLAIEHHCSSHVVVDG